jgi:hypothetical protein
MNKEPACLLYTLTLSVEHRRHIQVLTSGSRTSLLQELILKIRVSQPHLTATPSPRPSVSPKCPFHSLQTPIHHAHH